MLTAFHPAWNIFVKTVGSPHLRLLHEWACIPQPLSVSPVKVCCALSALMTKGSFSLSHRKDYCLKPIQVSDSVTAGSFRNLRRKYPTECSMKPDPYLWDVVDVRGRAESPGSWRTRETFD